MTDDLEAYENRIADLEQEVDELNIDIGETDMKVCGENTTLKTTYRDLKTGDIFKFGVYKHQNNSFCIKTTEGYTVLSGSRAGLQLIPNTKSFWRSIYYFPDACLNPGKPFPDVLDSPDSGKRIR